MAAKPQAKMPWYIEFTPRQQEAVEFVRLSAMRVEQEGRAVTVDTEIVDEQPVLVIRIPGVMADRAVGPSSIRIVKNRVVKNG